MKEYRCPKCKKILFEGDYDGKVTIKCKNCKRKTSFYEEKRFDPLTGNPVEISNVL